MASWLHSTPQERTQETFPQDSEEKGKAGIIYLKVESASHPSCFYAILKCNVYCKIIPLISMVQTPVFPLHQETSFVNFQNLDLPEIEKEVKRLLRTDNEATNIRWEVIREEDEKKNSADTNLSSSNLDGNFRINIYS